jgi:hypothetical protein
MTTKNTTTSDVVSGHVRVVSGKQKQLETVNKDRVSLLKEESLEKNQKGTESLL